VPVADKVLEGVTRIRLDASVVSAHSDKELAEPNFKGLWPPPAHISWSRTTDRNARTRPAREAFLRRFVRSWSTARWPLALPRRVSYLARLRP
jgi:hypothetical protein